MTGSARPLRLRVVLTSCLVAAAASGALVVLWRRPPPEDPRVEVRSASSTQQHTNQSAVAPLDQMRIAALENRVGALERQPSTATSTTAAPAEPSAEDVPVEQEKKDRTLRSRYSEEAPDPKWAATAAKTIKDTLDRVAAQATFVVDEVDCKTTMCVAKFKWPSYHAAHKEFMRTLGLRHTPCSTEIFLPEPEHGDEPYEASLMLDCEAWRTGTL
jgi:hypothetical protein